MYCDGMIWYQNNDLSFDGAFCVDMNGNEDDWYKTLVKYYNNENKIKALVDLKVIWKLGKYTGATFPNQFDNPLPDISFSLVDANGNFYDDVVFHNDNMLLSSDLDDKYMKKVSLNRVMEIINYYKIPFAFFYSATEHEWLFQRKKLTRLDEKVVINK